MAHDTFIPLKHSLSLRYFHEVARAGSFRKASDQIHVAASAINRHVKALEDDMGVLLFERGRGRDGVKLTAAGEVLLYRLKRAIAELRAARTEVSSLLGLDRGLVSLGVNEGIWREMLPCVLAAFRKAHPGIDYHILVGSSPRLIELLLSDEIDFALAFNPRAYHGVTLAVRRHVKAAVMMHRDHALAGRRSVRLRDCASYELVMPDESLALRATLDRMFEEAGIAPRAVLTTNSYEIMRTAAEAGVGIAILTQRLFERQPKDSSVVFIPLEDAEIAPQTIACCVRTGRILPGASQAMIADIERMLSQPS